jgi:ABC-type dipeptide/oligopeptide/nickel transport system permease component
MLHGDFGTSLYAHAPVLDLILQRLPTHARADALQHHAGRPRRLPLGVVSATHRDSAIDNVGRILAIVGVSVPVFWLGFLLILAFAVEIRMFPPGAR